MSENGSYFYHALRVDRNVCTGCTHCLRSCPTEAIRIRKGKAVIYNNKCIDCGECFKACPIHAIYIKQDDFELLDDYKYRIALVPATFIGQFPNDVKTSQIYACLKKIGFTHTYEVEHAVSFLNELYKQYMTEHEDVETFISPYCPAIVRLIQVRFPSLVRNIIHLAAPLDIASAVIRQRLVEAGIPSEDIGIFYVTPCAAKIAAVKSPAEGKKSFITGVINMDFLYNKVKLMLSS
ncbi:MAG: 4Fe-4S binding protein, partial [Bacteroidales bacterium]|nr:4Fe-4S binding protein [Bacteroidales bacterium]